MTYTIYPEAHEESVAVERSELVQPVVERSELVQPVVERSELVQPVVERSEEAVKNADVIRDLNGYLARH